jgi:putative ABC transport system permease protein
MATALAAVILFIAYLDVALNGDADVPNAQQVVRLETKSHTPGGDKNWIDASPLVFHDHWAKAGAPIVAATRYYASDMSVRTGARLALYKIAFVDAGIVDVFGLVASAGDLIDTLKRPDAVALSETMAARLFGNTPALGKTVQIAGTTLTVRALVPDRPSGSAISTDILVNIESPVMPEPFRLTFWFSIRGTNYVRLLPGATPEQFAERAQTYIEQTPAYRELPPAFGKIASYRALRLPNLQLGGAGSGPTWRLVIGLATSCLIITLLAAINYLNLSVVRTIGRQREIGIRKMLGASPARIAAQFLGESVFVALVACLIGLLLAWFVAPVFGEWVNRPIATQLVSPAKFAVALAAGVLLGLIAGAYPAWVAMRIDCAQSLAGRSDAETVFSLWFRRGLTVLQFAAAMALIGTTVVVLWQTLHAKHANPGYNTAPLLAIDAPVDMKDQRLLGVRDMITQLPGVQAVGLAWDIPGRFNRNTTTEITTSKGNSILLAYNRLGPAFFQSYGVTPIAGRIFDPESDKQGRRDIIVINAQATRELGFAKPQDAVGYKLAIGKNAVEIIGVVADIRQRSLRDAESGVIYGIDSTDGVSVVSIRSVDPARTRLDIQALWPQHFRDEFLRIDSVQAELERPYDRDQRLGQLIGAGGLIALGLAGFGLYAFSAYLVRRRTAEIVIRKLYGARSHDIFRLMAREFSASFAVGALLGLPIAAWLGERHLAEYVDRAPIGLWALAIALFGTALVAVLASTRHILSAMAIPPARAVRV